MLCLMTRGTLPFRRRHLATAYVSTCPKEYVGLVLMKRAPERGGHSADL